MAGGRISASSFFGNIFAKPPPLPPFLPSFPSRASGKSLFLPCKLSHPLILFIQQKNIHIVNIPPTRHYPPPKSLQKEAKAEGCPSPGRLLYFALLPPFDLTLAALAIGQGNKGEGGKRRDDDVGG